MAPENLIDRLISKAHVKLNRDVERLEKLRPALECANALKEVYPEVTVAEYLNGHTNVEVSVTVSNLKVDSMKYLEWIQDWAHTKGEEGFSFDESTDYVTEWSTDRDFHSRIFTLCCHIKGDSETCRKIVVGYQEVAPAPVYKIVCED